MRMLVTGSRDWADARLVRRAMLDYAVDDDPITVVHGDCPSGADAIADAVALGLSWKTERHPADWRTYGKGAGFRDSRQLATFQSNRISIVVHAQAPRASVRTACGIAYVTDIVELQPAGESGQRVRNDPIVARRKRQGKRRGNHLKNRTSLHSRRPTLRA